MLCNCSGISVVDCYISINILLSARNIHRRRISPDTYRRGRTEAYMGFTLIGFCVLTLEEIFAYFSPETGVDGFGRNLGEGWERVMFGEIAPWAQRIGTENHYFYRREAYRFHVDYIDGKRHFRLSLLGN